MIIIIHTEGGLVNFMPYKHTVQYLHARVNDIHGHAQLPSILIKVSCKEIMHGISSIC